MVQGGTVAGRLASTATTGGLANFVVNTVETIAGVAFSVLAIVVPVLAVVLLVVVVAGMYWVGRRVVRVGGWGDRMKTAPGVRSLNNRITRG